MNKVKIEINHGWITPIAVRDSNMELFSKVKGYEVIINGDEIHPVDVNILAINCGYNSGEQLIENYPIDFVGWLCNGNEIRDLTNQ